jgi:guanylate kinase
MTQAVILYGPPAAGKDSITAALSHIDERYSLFQRLKVGEGRTAGYRMTNAADVERLRAAGEVLWENRRYGALYLVDRPSLVAQLQAGIPVLHLGQPDSIEAIRRAVPASWLVVSVWCPREIARARIVGRKTGDDTDERLRAWDDTPALQQPDLAIDTSLSSVSEAANVIHDRVMSMATPRR